MPAIDVESLEPAHRHRSRCLHGFLLGSVILLLGLVLCGFALGFCVINELRGKVEHLTRAPESLMNAIQQNGGEPSNLLRMNKNFVHLIPKNSQLRNGTMQWEPITYGNSSTIGSHYSYDSNHKALTTYKTGAYILYTKLNLTCTGICSNGSLTVSFEDSNWVEHLSCTLQLPNTPPSPFVQNCNSVIPYLLGGTRLMARMHANFPVKGWMLNLNNSGFGLILVNGQ